jgi:flagellar biosynthesis protein FliQ
MLVIFQHKTPVQNHTISFLPHSIKIMKGLYLVLPAFHTFIYFDLA